MNNEVLRGRALVELIRPQLHPGGNNGNCSVPGQVLRSASRLERERHGAHAMSVLRSVTFPTRLRRLSFLYTTVDAASLAHTALRGHQVSGTGLLTHIAGAAAPGNAWRHHVIKTPKADLLFPKLSFVVFLAKFSCDFGCLNQPEKESIERSEKKHCLLAQKQHEKSVIFHRFKLPWRNQPVHQTYE